MSGESTGDGDVHALVPGDNRGVVAAFRDVYGPVTITMAGKPVPGYLQDPRRWPLVEEWRALAAGAHRTRPDDTGDAVPQYVARDIDTELESRLGQAAVQGGLVLVVGDSTAGKTRAAHHAVRACDALAGCRVLAPDSGPDLVIAIEVVAKTSVRCVVWLDDLERFLGPEGLEPAELAELVRLRIPVLATMQLRHYDTFYPQAAEQGPAPGSGPRAHGTGARVLKQTAPLHLPLRWSADELARARDCDDPRVLDAVTQHPFSVAEYLAAGPVLLTEWHRAARPGRRPRGAALVAAAVDLTRTGLLPPFPTRLLTALEQYYLPDSPLLRPEPLEEALAWATRVRHGATSLLLPTHTPDAWDVFDYLADHTNTPIATHVWETALEHANDEHERLTIAFHARTTAPYIAEAAWRALAPRNTDAAYHLGDLLVRAGRSEEAEQWLRRAADDGHVYAASNLANLLRRSGQSEEAEYWYCQAAEAGYTDAAYNLGVLLAASGRSEEAEQWYCQAADAGDTDAAFSLGFLLATAGRAEEAKRWYRQAAGAGHTKAAHNLGVLLVDSGRSEEAERWYRQAAVNGHTEAAQGLGVLLAASGRSEEAEQWFHQAAEAGHAIAAYNLAILVVKAGRAEEAQQWYRQAADDGHVYAANNLGVLLATAGRAEEAQQRFHQAADAGNISAAFNLGNLLGEAGRLEEAEYWYRQAAEAGYTDAAFNLGNLLVDSSRPEEAEYWYRQAVDAGHTDAATNLALLINSGRSEEVKHWYRWATDPE